MESVDDLLGVFQSLIQQATGVSTVIKANQGTPAPEGLHATYNPIVVRAVGHPIRNRSETPAVPPVNIPSWTDWDERIFSQMEVMLSCNFFNEGARDSAWRLHNANFRPSILAFLFENEIAMRYCSEVKDLTGLLQASVQPRFQVDVHLWVEAEFSETVLRAAAFGIEAVDTDDNVLFNGVSDVL